MIKDKKGKTEVKLQILFAFINSLFLRKLLKYLCIIKTEKLPVRVLIFVGVDNFNKSYLDYFVTLYCLMSAANCSLVCWCTNLQVIFVF